MLVSYTLIANTTCTAVLSAATEAPPLAADFDGGAPVYIALGTVVLTTSGSALDVAVPRGLNRAYRLALLPLGGGSDDVAVSSAIALDTTSGIVPALLGLVVSGSTSLSPSETLAVDMSEHNGSDDILVAIGVFGGNAGSGLTSVTFNGQTAVGADLSMLHQSTDGVMIGWVRFSATTFPATSSLVISGANFYDPGMTVYAIPAGTATVTLTAQPQSLREGSTLSGAVPDGAAVIACQLARNGTSGSWSGLIEDGSADIRSNEWFTAASTGSLPAATPMTITCAGTTVDTAGISVLVI